MARSNLASKCRSSTESSAPFPESSRRPEEKQVSLAGEFRRRLDMLLHRGRFQRELDEEMRLHLELRRKQQIASGTDPEAARWLAQRRFGNVTRIQEKSHMAWGWNWLETFLQDAGYGLRSMLRTPGDHGGRAHLAGPRHRRQHCHLQLSRCGDAALASGQAIRSDWSNSATMTGTASPTVSPAPSSIPIPSTASSSARTLSFPTLRPCSA